MTRADEWAKRDAEVRALLGAGLSIHQAAQQCGVSYKFAWTRAKALGLSLSRSHPNKEDHPWRQAKIGQAKTQDH